MDELLSTQFHLSARLEPLELGRRDLLEIAALDEDLAREGDRPHAELRTWARSSDCELVEFLIPGFFEELSRKVHGYFP